MPPITVPLLTAAEKYFTYSLLLFFSSLVLPFSRADSNLQLNYTSFQPNEPSLTFSLNSNVDNQALQVTRNSGSSNVSNISGRITVNSPLQLWNPSFNYTSSFNTSFQLNMGPIGTGGSNSTGGGMAFFLSDAVLSIPPQNSMGQWLGLFNSSIASDPMQARLVAIEFDTFKDSFDPDGNHIGIDVQGNIRSNHTERLSVHGITLSNQSGVNTSVWIDYDGQLHTLDVYLANQGPDMYKEKARHIISGYPIDLQKLLPETVYVGFSASSGTILEAHCVLQWNFTSTDFPANTGIAPAVIIGCSIGGAALIFLLVGSLAIVLVRRRRTADMMDDLTNLNYGPRKFGYRELKRATNWFSQECKLGQGGFGEVYKGKLKFNGVITEVAVKCLSQRSKQGQREFKAEVVSMGRMRHKNLVQLLGWSYGGGSRLMLVYEYMPNRSLDKWIGQGQEGVEVMGWERRYHVVKGLAAGLLYLHEEWEMVVVHRDLKPSNVMLDVDFNARIGDFGLAKLIHGEQDAAETATIAGTPGYIAPEYMDQGIVSKESDIYSFGAIAIELATGRRLSIEYRNFLAQLLEKSTLHKAADPGLTSFDPIQLELLLKLGLACCHPQPLVRPSIREVVHALSSSTIPFSIPSFASDLSSKLVCPTLLEESRSSITSVHLLDNSNLYSARS